MVLKTKYEIFAEAEQISMYSVFNLQPQEPYSIKDTGRITYIYNSYISKYEDLAIKKFGMSPEEFLNTSADFIALGENVKKSLEAFNQSRYSFNNSIENAKTIMNSLSDDASEKELQQALGTMKEFTEALKAYGESFSSVPNVFFDSNASSKEIKIGDKLRNQNISRSYSMDKKSLTALENMQKTIEALDNKIKKLESMKSIGTKKSFNTTRPGYIRVSGEQQKGRRLNIGTSTNKTINEGITSSLSNAVGFILELSIANAAQELINSQKSMIMETMLTGASGKQSVKLRNGQTLNYKESKADNKIIMKSNQGQKIEVGLSAKNYAIPHAGGTFSGISINSSSLSNPLTLATKSINDKGKFLSLLGYQYMVKGGGSSDEMKKIQMMFGALTADYAIAMGGNDRVDFMVTPDGVFTLSDFYRSLLETNQKKSIVSFNEKKSVFNRLSSDGSKSKRKGTKVGLKNSFYSLLAQMDKPNGTTAISQLENAFSVEYRA